MNENERRYTMIKNSTNKKKFFIMLFVAGVLIGIILFEKYHKSSSKINFIENATEVEYGNTTITSKALVKNTDGVIVTYPKLNVHACGEQDLVYAVVADGEKTNIHLKITVKDTQKPEIILKKERIAILYNGTFDIKDNIISVSDPVDGPLLYTTATDLQNNYYRIEGNVDTKKSGDHKIRVIAKDKSGNRSVRTFKVHVGKKPVNLNDKDKDKKKTEDKKTTAKTN